MPFTYSNNGFSFRGVPLDYQPQAGEAIFDWYASDDELEAAFPGYKTARAKTALEANIKAAENSMHAYVAKHYPDQLKLEYITIAVSYLLDKAAGNTPAVSETRLAALVECWTWTNSVVAQFEAVQAKYQAGQAVTAADLDWAAKFDEADPGYNSLDKLPE